ncbi:MAG: hypothetical protein ACK5KM_12400 [Hyphomicrobiaceae bacterium]
MSGGHSCTGGLLSALSGNPYVTKDGSVLVGSYPAADLRWSVLCNGLEGALASVSGKSDFPQEAVLFALACAVRRTLSITERVMEQA